MKIKSQNSDANEKESTGFSSALKFQKDMQIQVNENSKSDNSIDTVIKEWIEYYNENKKTKKIRKMNQSLNYKNDE